MGYIQNLFNGKTMKNTLLKLSEIKEMVNKMNEELCLDKNKLPSYGVGNEYNPTFVVVNKVGYSFFEFNPYHNKKNQHLIISTLNIDELLFEIFKDSTFFIGVNYEHEHRIPNQDTRIVMFNKHIEVLSSLQLDMKYINKLREYYDYLLQLKKPLPIPDKW